MKFMVKVSGLTLLIMSFLFLGAPKALAATSVSNVTFYSANLAANDPNASWQVGFTTSSSGALLAESGTITITIVGAVFPIYSGAYYINNKMVDHVPTPGTNSVTIVTPVAISNNQTVTVDISGLLNPSTAGAAPNTNFSVSTFADTNPVNPPVGQTFYNAITNVQYSFSNNAAGASNVTWYASFVTGSTGITGGTSTITLRGPTGTVFPSSQSDYQVNSTPVSTPVTLTGTNEVTLTSPVTVNASAQVNVTIAGVTNPGTSNQVSLFSPNYFLIDTSSEALLMPMESPQSSVVFSAVNSNAPLNFYVNTTLDTTDSNPGDGKCADVNGKCSLRAAIMEANADSNAPVNIYLPSGTYNLSITPIYDQTDGSNGELAVTTPSNVNILGSDPATTIIDGGGLSGSFFDRILLTSNNTNVTVSNVTFQNGVNDGSSGELNGTDQNANLTSGALSYNAHGGGAIAALGNLSLNNVVIFQNLDTTIDGGVGGGVWVNTGGNLYINGSTIKSNLEQGYYGGGVDCDGNCYVDSTTITNNAASNDGGAFDVDGSLQLTNSTLSQNTSYLNGGGAIGCYNICNVQNSTITGNKSQGSSANGGGISCFLICAVNFNTIYQNSAAVSGGGIYMGNSSTVVTALGNILASNTASNCGFAAGLSITDKGYNLSSDTSCGLTASTDLSNTNPQLGSLASNGGLTQTLMPASTSPVIDKVPLSNCLDFNSNPLSRDQRGNLRPVAGLSGNPDDCDLGSVEYNSSTLAPAVQSRFVGLTPYRICDTRSTSAINQCSGSTLPAGGTMNVQVTGFAGIPSDGTLTAVVLNVTAINPNSNGGYLTIWPQGQPQPTVSNLNWAAGETIANSVTVGVGESGQISLYNALGSVDIAIDVEGYYTSNTSVKTGLFNPVNPTRICDTRSTSSSNQCNTGSNTTLGAMKTLTVQVTGSINGTTTVPTGASAVVLNVTATNTTAPGGYLTVWPAGSSMPIASNLNFGPNDSIPNRVIVPLSASGQISIYNFNGNTDVLVDVNGYFTGTTGTTTGYSFQAIAPARVCDTRPTTQATQCADKTISAGGNLAVTIAGQNSISNSAVAMDANVTATNTTAWSYFTIYPESQSLPNSSDLNWSTGGVTIANQTITKLYVSGVSIYNAFGSADVIIDVDGFYI
jgi:CSLREA domain-containing protein